MATVRERTEAEVTKVRRAFLAGALKVGLNPDAGALLLERGANALGFTIFQTQAFATIVHNLDDLRGRISTWATTYRKWAEDGRRGEKRATCEHL